LSLLIAALDSTTVGARKWLRNGGLEENVRTCRQKTASTGRALDELSELQGPRAPPVKDRQRPLCAFYGQPFRRHRSSARNAESFRAGVRWARPGVRRGGLPPRSILCRAFENETRPDKPRRAIIYLTSAAGHNQDVGLALLLLERACSACLQETLGLGLCESRRFGGSRPSSRLNGGLPREIEACFRNVRWRCLGSSRAAPEGVFEGRPPTVRITFLPPAPAS